MYRPVLALCTLISHLAAKSCAQAPNALPAANKFPFLKSNYYKELLYKCKRRIIKWNTFDTRTEQHEVCVSKSCNFNATAAKCIITTLSYCITNKNIFNIIIEWIETSMLKGCIKYYSIEISYIISKLELHNKNFILE